MKEKHEKELTRIGEAIEKIQRLNWKPKTLWQKIRNLIKKI